MKFFATFLSTFYFLLWIRTDVFVIENFIFD